MKIALIGEYSRLHNSLKEGLIALGHKVTLIGKGDYFKQFPVDISIEANRTSEKKIARGSRKVLHKFTGMDIADWETYYKFSKWSKNLKDYDVVQLINERPFNISSYLEMKLLAKIFESRVPVFLLACGNDYQYVNFSIGKGFPFSSLSPYLKNPEKYKKTYQYILRRTSTAQKEIHDFVGKQVKAIIPVSIEYAWAYEGITKATSLIPNPINTDAIQIKNVAKDPKIHILQGLNTSNYIKKGQSYFTEALKIIQHKYPDRILITQTKNLSYLIYRKHLQDADILLDQALAHDQGYNALEAMAMGKVVFTGGGKRFKEYYGLTEDVIIEAIPNVTDLVKKLEDLILHPEKIEEISLRAREFVETHHHYKDIAKRYLEMWKTYMD